MIQYEKLSKAQKNKLIKLLSPHMTLLELNDLWHAALSEKKLMVALQIKKLLIKLIWDRVASGAESPAISSQEIQELIQMIEKWSMDEKGQ